MDEQQRQRILDRHRDSLLRHGHDPRALYWSRREIQEVRFQILAAIGISSGDSVLDVGCGFADFYRWIAMQGIDIEYSGLDLSPDLLNVARQCHPGPPFFCGDMLEYGEVYREDRFDWLILSGSLNEPLGDEGDYARRVIASMWSRCRKGVAFNLLDARHPPTRASWDLHSHDPESILAYSRSLTGNCCVIDDYLDNDFTVYLLRCAQNAYLID